MKLTNLKTNLMSNLLSDVYITEYGIYYGCLSTELMISELLRNIPSEESNNNLFFRKI